MAKLKKRIRNGIKRIDSKKKTTIKMNYRRLEILHAHYYLGFAFPDNIYNRQISD